MYEVLYGSYSSAVVMVMKRKYTYRSRSNYSNVLITRTTYLIIILFLPNSLNIPFFKCTRSFYLAERVFYWPVANMIRRFT